MQEPAKNEKRSLENQSLTICWWERFTPSFVHSCVLWPTDSLSSRKLNVEKYIGQLKKREAVHNMKLHASFSSIEIEYGQNLTLTEGLSVPGCESGFRTTFLPGNILQRRKAGEKNRRTKSRIRLCFLFFSNFFEDYPRMIFLATEFNSDQFDCKKPWQALKKSR